MCLRVEVNLVLAFVLLKTLGTHAFVKVFFGWSSGHVYFGTFWFINVDEILIF